MPQSGLAFRRAHRRGDSDCRRTVRRVIRVAGQSAATERSTTRRRAARHAPAAEHHCKFRTGVARLFTRIRSAGNREYLIEETRGRIWRSLTASGVQSIHRPMSSVRAACRWGASGRCICKLVVTRDRGAEMAPLDRGFSALLCSFLRQSPPRVSWRRREGERKEYSLKNSNFNALKRERSNFGARGKANLETTACMIFACRLQLIACLTPSE